MNLAAVLRLLRALWLFGTFYTHRGAVGQRAAADSRFRQVIVLDYQSALITNR